jgi:steroid 5-alpha reductase family enzyme
MQGPFFELLPVLGAIIALCWILSVITHECSWVDRIWSLTPPGFVTYVAYRESFADPRLNLMAVLVTLWGARLTYNFGRKGGYGKGGEDYRWQVLRDRLGPVKFQIFNATFIAPYQNVLRYLIAAPVHIAWLYRGQPLGALDVGLAILFLTLLAFETLADQQQWNFHLQKSARKLRGESIGDEFLSTGLFRYSRHPNYFCEIAQWWVFYAMACAVSGTWINWTGIGAVLLTLLFDGSTRFTEAITRKKYPSYADYQRTTSRLIPLPPRT